MIIRNLLFVVLALAFGGGGTYLLINSRPEAKKTKRTESGILVEVKTFNMEDTQAHIQGQGRIEPAQTMQVIAQVSGVVQSLHTHLVEGGQLSKGNKMIQIDPTDYLIAVNEAKARVEIAQQEVSLEEGRREIAQKEWAMMRRRKKNKKVSQATRDRALRVPQKRIGDAQLEIAKNALRRTQVQYQRTQIKAPFNALVVSENVEKGQLVGPGGALAQLVGTDAFWVTVSVPSSELKWIEFPQIQGKKKGKGKQNTVKGGSKALIRYDIGQQTLTREGHVIRRLSQIEPTGRMAQIVVEIPDPLGLESGKTPLLLGSQVAVTIYGKPLNQLIEIPRSALRDQNQVWVFSPQDQDQGERTFIESTRTQEHQGQLVPKTVEIMRRRQDTVLIQSGLSADEYVITSRISTPVPYMKLRTQSQLQE